MDWPVAHPMGDLPDFSDKSPPAYAPLQKGREGRLHGEPMPRERSPRGVSVEDLQCSGSLLPLSQRRLTKEGSLSAHPGAPLRQVD